MQKLSCEDVLTAQMAMADGEEPGLSKELLDAHVAGCANCRHELEQLQALDQVLAVHTLSEARVDLWPAIENSISKRVRAWQSYALIGLLLVIYKLLEMLPARDPGMAINLVPLVIVVLLFVLNKENPFKIKTELVLER